MNNKVMSAVIIDDEPGAIRALEADLLAYDDIVVADTQIIGKQTDRTLFIVRAGLLERSMLQELETVYEKQRFKNLSVILNGTESGAGRYGYKYGYRYGYVSDGYYSNK